MSKLYRHKDKAGKIRLKSMHFWAKEYNMPYQTLRRRLAAGKTMRQAITEPIRITNCGKSVRYNGTDYSYRALAEIFGMDKMTLWKMINVDKMSIAQIARSLKR